MRICSSCNNSIDDDDHLTCQSCNKQIHKECAITKDGVFCDLCYVNKGNDESEEKKDIEVPDVIRRSHIETYRTCPYKFYNEVILDNPMPENMYTKLGVDLHELFEKACLDNEYKKDEMTNDFMEMFQHYDEDLFDNEEKKAEMYVRGVDSIETFYHVIKDMPPAYDVEVKTQFSIGENLPEISATFDRVNLVDGELEVVDWKTGNVLVGKNLSSDFQAPIYIYGIKQYYDMPVRKFTFYYLKDNKVREFNRIDDSNVYVCMVGKRKYVIDINKMLREVQHLFSQIMKGNFNIPIDTSKMYFPCKMCHIREQGKCEGADIQVWRQFNK